MSLSDHSYLKNDFNFQAGRINPKGLDYTGVDDIRSMATKIDIASLREHFCDTGEMNGKAYQDFIYEVMHTRSKFDSKIIFIHK